MTPIEEIVEGGPIFKRRIRRLKSPVTTEDVDKFARSMQPKKQDYTVDYLRNLEAFARRELRRLGIKKFGIGGSRGPDANLLNKLGLLAKFCRESYKAGKISEAVYTAIHVTELRFQWNNSIIEKPLHDGLRLKQGRSKAGKNTSRRRREDPDSKAAKILAAAKTDNNTASRDLAGKLAKRFGCSADYVRRVLKKQTSAKR